MRRITGWAVLPKNWQSDHWWCGADIADKITQVGLFASRDEARDCRSETESVVKVNMWLYSEGGN